MSATRSTRGTGRQIWHYQRAAHADLTGNAPAGINRGVALAGDRVFKWSPITPHHWA